MTVTELELEVRRELDDLIAEVEYELDRDLDADERASVVDEFLAGLDDDDEVAVTASPAAFAETAKRKALLARLFDCGGPGSGVPGPCPEGDKETGGEQEDQSEEEDDGDESEEEDAPDADQHIEELREQLTSENSTAVRDRLQEVAGGLGEYANDEGELDDDALEEFGAAVDAAVEELQNESGDSVYAAIDNMAEAEGFDAAEEKAFRDAAEEHVGDYMSAIEGGGDHAKDYARAAAAGADTAGYEKAIAGHDQEMNDAAEQLRDNLESLVGDIRRARQGGAKNRSPRLLVARRRRFKRKGRPMGKAKQVKDRVAPTPDEDEGDFMDRCTAAGYSESECELIWEDMGNKAEPVAGKALTTRMKADDTAELLLYDIIGSDWFGEGVTAKRFREQVQGVKARTLNLRINSPGGSVTEGSAMLAALDDWKRGKGRRIEVDVDGVAASAASVVMMAGNVIRVAANGLVMIHDPHAMVAGGANEMRRTADLLDKVKGQLIDAYARRSKLSRADLSAAMSAETWYTGAEAVVAGLADSVGEQVSVAAFAGLPAILAKMKYRHPPDLPTDAAAWAETLKRKQIAARFFDCGGPGSGVPGPCPEGDKGDKGGQGDKGKDEPPPPNSRGGKDNTPNPSLPKESRPELSKSEASAATNYSGSGYEVINKELRSGKEPPTDKYAGQFSPDKVHGELQKVFEKTPPFKEPVDAKRGLNLIPEAAKELHDALQAAKANGGTIRLPGYTSTHVGAAHQQYSGNVTMNVKVIQGLDMMPYSPHPQEHELLLNHNSTFKVVSISPTPKGYHVELEQVQPQKQKEKEEKSEKAGRKTVWQKLKSAFGGG